MTSGSVIAFVVEFLSNYKWIYVRYLDQTLVYTKPVDLSVNEKGFGCSECLYAMEFVSDSFKARTRTEVSQHRLWQEDD